LEHLEIKRNLTYSSISSLNPLKLLDTEHYPDNLKQKIEVRKLKTLIIENCMSVYLILDLVQTNKHLKKLRIKRKSFHHQMILSDTLFLEEIDVKLSPVVSYITVQNKRIRN
jgi:hypothetical protein